MATVVITITDAEDSPDHVATIETKTNWNLGDPDSPAVEMAMGLLQLIHEIRDEAEGEGIQ